MITASVMKELNLSTLSTKTKLQFTMTLSVVTCLSAGPKYVDSVLVYFKFDKNLYVIHYYCDLPNDGKQKQRLL